MLLPIKPKLDPAALNKMFNLGLCQMSTLEANKLFEAVDEVTQHPTLAGKLATTLREATLARALGIRLGSYDYHLVEQNLERIQGDFCELAHILQGPLEQTEVYDLIDRWVFSDTSVVELEEVSPDDFEFLKQEGCDKSYNQTLIAMEFFRRLRLKYHNLKTEKPEKLILETLDETFLNLCLPHKSLSIYLDKDGDYYRTHCFLPLAKLAAKVMGVA